MTAIGTVWSLLVVDRLSAELQQLTDARVNLTREIQDLNGFEYQYFITNQQRDLIFILAQNERARQELAQLVYQGNVLDRATPVRNMIAALETANLLDHRQSYNAYEKINNEHKT